MSTISYSKHTNFNINPKQFTLWVFLVSSTMLFAGFTSAYIVRKAEGNWLEFELPSAFLYSLITVLASSVVLAFGQWALQKQQARVGATLVLLSAIGGASFILLQFEGWSQLFEQAVVLVGNASGGFLYIISGIHLLHVLGGLIALSIVGVRVLLKPTAQQITDVHTASIFWHFIGVLWLYLYLFFKFV